MTRRLLFEAGFKNQCLVRTPDLAKNRLGTVLQFMH